MVKVVFKAHGRVVKFKVGVKPASRSSYDRMVREEKRQHPWMLPGVVKRVVQDHMRRG